MCRRSPLGDRMTSPSQGPGDIAANLVEFCCEQMEALAALHLRGLALPRTYGGHEVGADVRADLLFTVGLLGDAGVTTIAGRAIDDILVQHLGAIDGGATHTFFSYRVAETVARAGVFAANPLLETLSVEQRDEVERACDSTAWIALLADAKLPRNYAAVLARCELARTSLGLAVNDDVLDDLLGRVVAVLGENPNRYLDDSNDAAGRFDIYTVDVWLFCAPFADQLGDLWRDGMAATLDLVDAVGARDGAAISWGRSTGVLAVAHTIELAALALQRGLVVGHEGAWLRRAADATYAMRGWYRDGVVNAHQYRDQDRYRGPARRLQLTLDVLGKLAWAAGVLREVATRDLAGGDLVAAPIAEAYRPVDRIVAFDPDRAASVWAFRNRALAFAVPFVGGARSHYLPGPYAPGCFEAPVDTALAVYAPTVFAGHVRYAGGGVPASVVHAQDDTGVTVTWRGFVAMAAAIDRSAAAPLSGERMTTYRVERRSLVIDEVLTFDETPDAVSVLVPELSRRPLTVTWATRHEHTATAVDVLGLAEWRSSWSELVTAHQLDLVPGRELRYSMRVTPKLRVASTAHGHHYHRSLYGPLTRDVVTMPSPLGVLASASDAAAIDEVDVFHMHWPEWVAFDDLAAHDQIIATLRDRDIPIVWTAHNLTPHEKRPDVYDAIYQRWTDAADAIIHHSHWGEQLFRSRYPGRAGSRTRHEVIAHGHFGDLWGGAARVSKRDAETALGFAPCAIRIGIVGAPRAEKRVDEFVAGFNACGRDDIQLAVWSLRMGDPRPGKGLPHDPRIVAAESYRMVPERVFATRLAACDVLALPFDPDGEMLATGTAADALGLGMPALRSDWGYLIETLADAGISCGHTAAQITECLNALTLEQLATARTAAQSRRDSYAWPALAQRTFALLERVQLNEP